MLTVVDSRDVRAVAALLAPARRRDLVTERRVASIVTAVKRTGDLAVTRFATSLDNLDGPLEVSRDEMIASAATVARPVRAALRTAAKHIRAVAKQQVPKGWRVVVDHGIEIESRVRPLDRVGCYVPGGRYPLPSSLLMTAIPARAAGVPEVIAVCPRPAPAVMAAAIEAGVDRLFRVGGAHAVAAMAYGTASIPRVDKIVGPGNRYVAAAKALISPDCGIDFYAGPSEIVIIASRGRAEWIAADLIAQAEHDPDARAVLITPNASLAARVVRAVAAQLPETGPARAALRSWGGVIVTGSLAEAIALANEAAPEHVVVDDDAVAGKVRCAGSVFVGPWSAQVAGDYALGSNHVLPTAGAARVRGGLSAADFVRQVTVQRVTERGLSRVAPVVTTLARTEGLLAHARSIERRLGQPGARRPSSGR